MIRTEGRKVGQKYSVSVADISIHAIHTYQTVVIKIVLSWRQFNIHERPIRLRFRLVIPINIMSHRSLFPNYWKLHKQFLDKEDGCKCYFNNTLVLFLSLGPMVTMQTVVIINDERLKISLWLRYWI